MASSAPSKRLHRANTPSEGKGLGALLWPYLKSTVGAKFIVALTGVGLTLFVIAHMIGNLQILTGQEKINTYARFLKDLGPMLWAARIGLLALFVLHIYLSLSLKKRSYDARPIGYAHEDTVQASLASRTMLYTGLVILVFTLFHLAHFTFGWIDRANLEGQVVQIFQAKEANTGSPIASTAKSINTLALLDPHGRHDVYSMMIFGFRNPVVAILYIIAQLFLLMHLSHGVASTFQSLGANSPRWQPAIRMIGWAITLVVTLGNIFMVVAVWLGWVGLPPVLFVHAA